MTRGLGERQRKDRFLTTSKIASYLAVRPFTYQELQRESKIQRKRLRNELDELVLRKLAIKHKFSMHNDSNLEHNNIYYLLNWSKDECKQLVHNYYDNIPSAINKDSMSNNQDHNPIPNQINSQSLLEGLRVVARHIPDMSHEELREGFDLSLKMIRALELRSVKERIKIEDYEPSDLNLHYEIVNFFLRKGYSFLDALIKSSADEKLVRGRYRYSTLWEALEKRALLDKYKSEIH